MATGCYDPQYLTASFKGVTFEATDATSEHGRRGAEGEFPFSETTAYADLGRRIRRYTIRARFAENSHLSDAGAVIAACESPQPGILVHPTRGAIRVACKTITVTDNILEEQGVSYADIEFVEANEWVNGGLNLTSLLGGLSISGITDAANAFFTSNYLPRQVRFFQSDELRDTTSQGILQARDAFAEVTAEGADVDIWRALSDMEFASRDSTVLNDADESWNIISATFGAIDARSFGEEKIEIFRRLANWAAQSPTQSGMAGVGQDAVFGLFRMLSSAYIVRGALESEPRTLNDALEQYDIVVSLLNQELEAAKLDCDNCRHLAIREFLTTAQTSLLNRAYELPPVVQYNFGGGVHALVAAHEIFGCAKEHRQIERRNSNQFPWVVGPSVIAVRQ